MCGLESGGGGQITVQDIRDTIQANLGRLQDIEFILSERQYVEKADVLSLESHITIAWHLGNRWEKRTAVHLGSRDNLKHVTIQSWDGGTFVAKEDCFEPDGSPTSRRRDTAGRSSRQPTLQDDLFAALLMRINQTTYLDWLTTERATVVGTELIDGRNTTTVREGAMSGVVCRQYYLDVARGAVPLKAEVYVQGQLKKTGKNVVVAEVGQGLFLPVKGEVFCSANHEGKHRVAEYSIDTASIKVNQGLSKEHFRVELGAG